MSNDARSGLKRQIVLAMAALALAVILLSVLGSYAFYAFFMTYSPSSISDSWLPNDVEIAWMLATTYSRHILDLELSYQPNARTETGPPQVTQHLTVLTQV